MSDEQLIPLIIGAFAIGFPLLWFFVTRLLMKVAGMTRDVDAGPVGRWLEAYGTGSARIRGVSYNGVLSVDRHERGYLLRVTWIFGGGGMTIADEEIVSVNQHGAGMIRSLLLSLANGRSIRFFGKLADKISEEIELRR